MPKGRIHLKGETYNKSVKRGFRIGGRKAGKSAHRMTNKALVDVLGNKNLRKHHHKAATILKSRDVDYAKLFGPEA